MHCGPLGISTVVLSFTRPSRVALWRSLWLTLSRLPLKTSIPSLTTVFPCWSIFGPRRSLSPIVDELADELAGKLAVAKCNVDDNQDLAMKFGVMSIPTLIVFKNGEEVDRSVGALPKARLQALLKKHL